METFGLIIGGIGLFLLGMHLLTEGLKAMAGQRLKEMLKRFTGGTFSAILTGAGLTALIQSSSAATFMTIGFVSAGLLSFSQSVGVIIGANVGSTSTGWIVSAIGLQINMSLLALPLIGAGTALKVLFPDRFSAQGLAVAGFGLLFLGIDILQTGMSAFTHIIDLSVFPGEDWWWIPVLLFTGIIMTVILQSSSAAVVTTITALHTGTIDFHQAALLVIGQNIGTTVKAFLAALGGSHAAKRTATAHILFNLLTGFTAVLLLPVLIRFVMEISSVLHVTDTAVKLALFHTVFNFLGVLLVLLIFKWFILLVKKIIPARRDKLYTAYLDPSVAELSAVALEAARRSVQAIILDLAVCASDILKGKELKPFHKGKFEEMQRAVIEIQHFLTQVSAKDSSVSNYEVNQYTSLVHALDHVERLLKALNEVTDHLLPESVSQSSVRKIYKETAGLFDEISKRGQSHPEGVLFIAEITSKDVAAQRRDNRKKLFDETVKEEFTVNEAISTVKTIHWLDRITYHMWRALYHSREKADREGDTD